MLLPVDDALERIKSAVSPTGTEIVSLELAAGRILAETVLAKTDNPPFHASAMDGYAVRAADVRDGAILKMIGASQAGEGFSGSVVPGTCASIFTGAPVPEGADAVVMQEQTTAIGDAITFLADTIPGKNIRPHGQDFCSGDVLIEVGTRLTPQHLALAAAANNSGVTVSKSLSVALMATGDELVRPGSLLAPGQIVGSNSFGLSALFAPYAGTIEDHGIVRDDMATLVDAVRRALDGAPDVLVTTGGASVGEHDLVQDALKANGVEIDFWRIAMRPGKPLMFGRKGKTIVFGLPGNPVSAIVTATVFVLPAMRAMLGETPPAPKFMQLAAPLPPNGPRRHYVRAFSTSTDSGLTGVSPVGETDSGHLSSLAKSDCLIVQQPHDQGKTAGEPVEVIAL